MMVKKCLLLMIFVWFIMVVTVKAEDVVEQPVKNEGVSEYNVGEIDSSVFKEYLTQVQKIILDVQILLRGISLTQHVSSTDGMPVQNTVAPRADYKYEAGEMEKYINKWRILTYPEEIKDYHEQVLEGMNKLKTGLDVLSPKEKDAGVSDVREGARLLKEGVLEIKKIGEETGVIPTSPPVDESSAVSGQGEDLEGTKTD